MSMMDEPCKHGWPQQPTPEQRLKGIFQRLDEAEKLPEPQRTNQLRKMLQVALRDLEHVKMPEAEQPNAAGELQPPLNNQK